MALYPNEHETIEGVGRALRAGQTTCVEVLKKCFDRIEEWEPRIKAWVRVDRAGALEQARALDEELAAGRCRGPLHGIPIGIKDIIDVKGLPTAAGFGPWRDRVADSDAMLVLKLRCNGAVILGKTVTTQFAWIDPPPTRNPWNLERTPGGSSSGSAAAVAVGMCLGAIGTQTGGSIIRPASFCGVCGLKPTMGAVSRVGVFPFAPSFDHFGPIARTTRDLRLIFEGIRDRGMQEIAPEVLNPTFTPEQVEGLVGEILSARVRPPRLSRPRGFYDDRADPVMTRSFEVALKALAAAGAEVFDLPEEHLCSDFLDFEEMIRDHRTIMCVEAAAGHEARFLERREEYAPKIAALIEEGLSTPAVRLLRAQEDQVHRRVNLDTLFSPEDAGDALITPATIGPAPDPSTTGDPAFNSPWSEIGWPAVSVPIGLSPEGLPLALQLVGVGDDVDSSLLETASWCEDVIRRAYRASARSD